MEQVRVQINHTEALSKADLALYMFNEIGEEYNLTEDDVVSYFTIESTILIPNGTFITVFSIDIPNIGLGDTGMQVLIKSYLNTLKTIDCVLFMIKLQDSLLYRKCYEYYEKISEIEMELRNVLTYILTYDDKVIDGAVLKDFGVSLVKSYQPNMCEDQHENGLFYILFNDYASFSEPPKNLKAEKVAELLQDFSINSFEEFRERIQRRHISEDRHKDFLLSIKDKLEPLERMRNATMHIRNLSNTLISNFEKAAYDTVSGLQVTIKNFWINERYYQNEKTWILLADAQIEKLISIEPEAFRFNAEYHDGEFDENYSTIDEFREELVRYLIERVDVPGYNAETEEFLPTINELIDRTLTLDS